MTVCASSSSLTGSHRSPRKNCSSRLRAGDSGDQSFDSHPLKGVSANCNNADIKLRFEITKKLGSGTYGKVSLAYDHKNESEVAVKLIKKSAIESKQDLVRIRREIKIMSALQHPNIIQIFEVFENRDKIILVMEYANGGELYDYVGKYGSLPESEARRIFRQITSAVLYCHKNQVAHRDLKLENILLDQANNAKIADFGLSNYFSNIKLLSTFCGSPLYASPEIINGIPYKGPEVDCWSLGILLYTLIYGSMPFDGRDFNRMVRQIKRGAYFEPDTPSTASMLIRNMLRVNSDKRADIYQISNHWWLNLEENMPVIQELPENQIVDSTPLTERAETILVQDLTDETDVFMEFGHLSAETRLKIEHFRRRRKDAEDYIENSPIKPPKARKTNADAYELTNADKSLRGTEQSENQSRKETNCEDGYIEPLERLKQLESRLCKNNIKDRRASNAILTMADPREIAPSNIQGSEIHKNAERNSSNACGKKNYDLKINQEWTEDPATTSKESGIVTSKRYFDRISSPSSVPVKAGSELDQVNTRPTMNMHSWYMESDTLNIFMNQVLEQMEKGPVSMNLITRIKAHPLYDSRPMVKELLESIIAAQPQSIQQQASKIIQQQSQDLIRRHQVQNVIKAEKFLPDVVSQREESSPESNSNVVPKFAHPDLVQFSDRKYQFDERPWHSVEVGFDPDEDDDDLDNRTNLSRKNSTADRHKNTNVKSKERRDSVNSAQYYSASEKPAVRYIEVTADVANSGDAYSDDDEKLSEESNDSNDVDSNTDIDELGKEVEQVEDDEENESFASALSSNVDVRKEISATLRPSIGDKSEFLDNFDRILIKRQSKGKYQHSKVEMYGRGVSMECDSPNISHRRIGGPQPTIEHSPFLFDKAKKYIMTYPKHTEDSEEDTPNGSSVQKTSGQTNRWLKTSDPEAPEPSSGQPSTPGTSSLNHSNTSIQPHGHKDEHKEDHESQGSVDEDEDDEDEDDENDEDEDDEEGIQSDEEIENIEENGEEVDEEEEEEESKSIEKEGHNSADFERCNKLSTTEHLKDVQPASNSNLHAADTTDVYCKYGRVDRFKITDSLRRQNNENNEFPVPRSRLNCVPLHEALIQDSDQLPCSFTDDHDKSKLTATPARYNIDNIGGNYDLIRNRMNAISPRAISPEKPEISNLQGTRTVDIYGANPRIDGLKKEAHISPTVHSWAVEPKKFLVYQTRAEREAERNAAASSLYQPCAYRTPGSWWHSTTAYERPISSYTPGYYRSRFDDSSIYRRRPNDLDPSNTVGEVQRPTAESRTTQDYGSAALSRTRPLSIRATVNCDSELSSHRRSQSMDRKSYYGEDFTNHRMVTPEFNSEKTDHCYLNHDISSRTAYGRESDSIFPSSRAMLKNKQSKGEDAKAVDLYKSDGTHSPFYIKEQSSDEAHQRTDSQKRKRGFISLGRRRTTEMRLHSDGRIVTTGIDDDSKRPASPIDRIKSFFRKSKESISDQTSKHAQPVNHDYSQLTKTDPLSVANRYSISDTIHNIHHQPINHSPIGNRESFTPQYRKYQAGINSQPAVNYSRYSYIPTGEQIPDRLSRNLYDETHLL